MHFIAMSLPPNLTVYTDKKNKTIDTYCTKIPLVPTNSGITSI